MVFARRSLHHQESALGRIHQGSTLFPTQWSEARCNSHKELEAPPTRAACRPSCKTLQPLLNRIQSLEQALKEAQQQSALLETALQSVSDAIEITNAQSKLEYVNPAFEAITGYTCAEVMGKTPAELFRGAQHDDAFYQSMWQTISSGQVWQGELISKHKEGFLLHQEATVSPIFDPTGAITHYVAVKRNVTQRKQTEAEWLKFVALVENSNDFIAMSGLDGTVFYVNAAGQRLVGLKDLEAAQAKSISEYLPREDLADFCEVTLPAIKATGRHSGEGQLQHFQTGERIQMHRSCFAVRHPVSQELLCLATIQRDITPQKQAERALKESEERFRAIAEALPLSMVISHVTSGTILYANPEVESTFGLPAAQMVGCQTLDLYADPVDHSKLLKQLNDDGFLQNYEAQAKKRDGTIVWVAVSLRFLTFDGETALLSVFSEITERKQAEARFRLMERAIAASSNGIVLTDASQPDNPIIYANPAFEGMTGYSSAEVIGRNCRFLQGLERDQPDLQTLRAAIKARRECHVTLRNYHKDGTPFWNELYVSPVFDPNGCVTHFVGIQTDISDRKRMEDQLVHAALHDALTQLPNRVLFMNRLTHAISSQRNQEHHFAVLFLDLDRFKVVNDSLGHIVGDQLLVAIAQRLQTCLRPGDTIARFGGDEFTILLDPITQTGEATQIAEHILQALQVPFNLNGSEVFTTASIGIALSAPGYTRSEEVLRDADAALYRAKEQGKACYAVFDSEMYERAVALLQLETDLRRAISRQELRVFYQPIVSLFTGRIVGFEALVRWQHSEKGLISPAEFIPMAEETGLIVPIGQWVLQESCQQLRQWQVQFPSALPLTMSVNLSAKQFSQPDLAKQVAHILQRTGIDPTCLKLEITESGIMQNAESSALLLNHLQELQVQLCIDDFGTGYSSLSRLHHFPINTLKIDRAFVCAMQSEGENAEIVQAIITLAQNLGMDVVAEGVETATQFKHLQQLGCELGQGYFFAKPLNAQATAELLASAPHW